MFLDLDGFKRSTDTLGHGVGDALLPAVATQRALTVLRLPFQVAGHAITVTASLGVAVFPDDGGDAATLLKHADTAMYHAKDEGRNNWQMYSRRL